MYDRDEKTKLVLTHCGNTITWEGSPDAGLTEILNGFIGCLRGVTFGEWVIRGIRDYCNEYLDDLPEMPDTITIEDCRGCDEQEPNYREYHPDFAEWEETEEKEE